jgi:hypothetical protein
MFAAARARLGDVMKVTAIIIVSPVRHVAAAVAVGFSGDFEAEVDAVGS